ncbi:MAG: type VI secretion system baseplate subunit TssG [Desulfovibrio sp.]|jgi:type VI secretion system protein ImpH|nr:type VI secretion system baseplate subunit TssG [Desulfovibrio sp.]
MAQAQNRILPPIIRDLIDQPQQFSFSQLMLLLRQWSKPASGAEWEAVLRGRVRFRPTLSLGFAVTDVDDLNLELSDPAQDRCPFTSARITASFLGLYGASSPLPMFYTERLLDEKAEDCSAMRDFLDIFNNAFFLLNYRLSRLVYPLHNALIGYDHDAKHMLMSLASFGNMPLREKLADEHIFLRYAGLFSMSTRSALGLRTMLADASGGNATRIHCNILRHAPVPAEQQTRLGLAASTLGEDLILGDSVPCYQGKIAIEFYDLDEEAMQRLLPGTSTALRLHALIRNYCREPLDYEVLLRMRADSAQPFSPGGNAHGRFARLGHDVWLGFGGDAPDAALPRSTALFPAGYEN